MNKQQLGDLIEVQSGFAFKSKEYRETGHFLIRIGNVQDGYISLDNPKYVQLCKKTAKFALEEGDFLTSLTGNIGRVAVVDATHLPAALNQRVARLKVRDESKLSSRYLLHFLSSDLFREALCRSGHGAAQQNVSPSTINTLAVPLPPPLEQRRIVGILDEAFDGIATAQANAEKNLQNARALFESYLNAVFTRRGEGWIEKPLKDLGTTQTGSTPKGNEEGNYGNFIPFIKPADFHVDGSLDYKNSGLSEQGLSKARKVATNSVLMVCIGATIGKCGSTDREITTNQQINAFTPSKAVNYKFAYYQMVSNDFQARVLWNSGQATLPIINKGRWSSLVLAFPANLDEQRNIVSQLDSLSVETQRLESIYQRKLAALEELKKSLLHQAFSGQL